MNQKQLANVLNKILGLSVCLHAIPNFISNLLIGLFYLLEPPITAINATNHVWIYTVSEAIETAMGIFLIVRSRSVAEKLFQNEDEQPAQPGPVL